MGNYYNSINHSFIKIQHYTVSHAVVLDSGVSQLGNYIMNYNCLSKTCENWADLLVGYTEL